MIRKLFESLLTALDEDVYTPKSRVQKVLKQIIDRWGDKMDQLTGTGPGDRRSSKKGLMYAFHDDSSIATDGDLYDILNYGHGDYNYGQSLSDEIHRKLGKMGYSLENAGQGIFNIVKESLQERVQKVKESQIKEGQFSWKLPNGTPIYNEGPKKQVVYMYDDKGNVWKEPDYEGYGVFGGKDFYDLLAEMNGVTEAPEGKDLRDIGIDIAFNDNGSGDNTPGVKYPRFSLRPNDKYELLPNPISDPNQGWYDDDEWDEDEEDDEGSWRDDESVKEAEEDLIANKQTDPALKGLAKEVEDEEEHDLEEVPDAPETEEEEDEYLDKDGSKEYLGNNDHDTFFYLIKIPNEEGGVKELQIVDAGGDVQYSSEDNKMDVADVKNFILEALKELEIANLSYDITLKYLVPDEDEVEAEEEGTQKPPENPEPIAGAEPELQPPSGAREGKLPPDPSTDPEGYITYLREKHLTEDHTPLKIVKAGSTGWKIEGAQGHRVFTSREAAVSYAKGLVQATQELKSPQPYKIVAEEEERDVVDEEFEDITQQLINALQVIMQDPKISSWLKENDPKAYEQAILALDSAEGYGEEEGNYYPELEEMVVNDGKLPPDPSTDPEGYIGYLREKHGLDEERGKYADGTPYTDEEQRQMDAIAAASKEYGFGTVAWQDALMEIYHDAVDRGAPVSKGLASFLKTQIEHMQRVIGDREKEGTEELTNKWKQYDMRGDEEVEEGKLPPDPSTDPEGYMSYLREKHGLDEQGVPPIPTNKGLPPEEDMAPEPEGPEVPPEEPAPGESGEEIAQPPMTVEEAEAQIRMDYPEEPFTSTALAYADLIVDNPQVFGAIRNLHWDGVYTDGDTFVKQAKIIGKYNNFDDSEAQRLVDRVRQSGKYRLARDGSVAVYITITDPKYQTSLEALKAVANADNVEKTGQPGEVKIWWD